MTLALCVIGGWTAAMAAAGLAREAGSYRTGRAALQAAARGPGTVAILMGAEYLVVREQTADRLAELGLPFAYLGEMRNEDGRDVVVTVPVN